MKEKMRRGKWFATNISKQGVKTNIYEKIKF